MNCLDDRFRYSKTMPIQERYIFCDEHGLHSPLDISAQNRALRYGDGLFDTMLVERGEIRLLDLHLNRMASGAKILYFEPQDGTLEHRARAIVEKLLIGQPRAGYARMRISAFRAPGGNYLPNSNAFQMIGEIHPLPHHPHLLQAPRRVHVADDYPIAYSRLSWTKSINALPYVLAAIQAQQNACNDALLLNLFNEIAELTSSNLFLVIDGRIHTPPYQSGCIRGIMRALTCATVASAFKYQVIDDEPLTIGDLSRASEAFCTNVIQGIQPIGEIVGTGYQAVEFPVMMRLRKMFSSMK